MCIQSTHRLYAIIFTALIVGQAAAQAPISVTTVGSPNFDVVDLHLFAAPTNIFPALFPNHFPRITHLPPYDQELGDGLLANGISDEQVFEVSDFTAPNAVHLGYVLVPNATAPTGSSPDYAAGPIIPNPIAIRGDVFLNGAPFELLAFNLTPTPAAGIDGASHYVVENWENSDFAPPGLDRLTGDYEYRLTMRDSVNNNGYDILARFSIVPEPGSSLLLAVGCIVFACARRRRALAVN